MSTTPPANTEFLTVKLELMTAERDKLQLELGDLRVLRAARPAPPPADHIGDATKLVGERAALIAKLRDIPPNPFRLMMWEAADMLAADAQTSPSHPQFVAGFKAGHAAGKRREDAQQMAILQEKDKLFEGLSTGQVMQKAFAWCPTDHPHQWRMQWIADYFIANAPTLPQAERLLMTPEQISDTYKKATGQTLRPCDKHAVETLTREIEAHHEIGVKP